MRLCVFGNSHAGALNAAIREYPRADLSLGFIAKPKLELSELEISGSVVKARSRALVQFLQGQELPCEFDLTEFDGIVLAGMSASVFSVSSLVNRHWVYGWPSMQQRLLGHVATNEPLKKPLLSEAAILAALIHTTQSLTAYRLLKAIRDTNSTPVYILPQPYPSERVLAEGARYPVLKRIHRSGDGPKVVELLERSYREAFGAFAGITLLVQHPRTVAAGWLTSDAYTRDSVRVSGVVRQAESDILHANASFGNLVLDTASEAIFGMKNPKN